jgi:hypothetical protein
MNRTRFTLGGNNINCHPAGHRAAYDPFTGMVADVVAPPSLDTHQLGVVLDSALTHIKEQNGGVDRAKMTGVMIEIGVREGVSDAFVAKVEALIGYEIEKAIAQNGGLSDTIRRLRALLQSLNGGTYKGS